MRKALLLFALIAVPGPSAWAASPADAALTAAVHSGDVAAARAALAAHADPDARLAFRATPLAWAVETQNTEMVELLLAHHASPDARDDDGTTPLAIGCELGDAKIVTRLIVAGASAKITDREGVAPLAVCAGHAPAETVSRLVAAGASVDAVDMRGQTALMWAAAAGRTEAMKLLLQAGAGANRVSKGGFTPLFFAIKSNVPMAADTLLAAGADATYRGPEGTSALQLALYQRNWAVAEELVRHGNADLVAHDRNGNQPLHVAAIEGQTSLVSLLLSKGADPNALTGPSRIEYRTEANFGVPPPRIPPQPALLLAAAKGHADSMRALLAAGADGRFKADDGTSVLLAAAQGENAMALDIALAIMPDATAADANEATALHLLLNHAQAPDFQAMLKLLAAHGAKGDARNGRGQTPNEIAMEGSEAVKAAYFAAFPPKAAPPKALANAATR